MNDTFTGLGGFLKAPMIGTVGEPIRRFGVLAFEPGVQDAGQIHSCGHV
jgi:hypothetical protein